MTAGQPHVLWLDDDNARGNPSLGGKFSSLSEMTHAGFAVPPGFGITTTAFWHFLESAGLADTARQIRARVVNKSLSEVEAISREVTQQIETAPLPPDLEATVRGAYDELVSRTGRRDVPVAVRSSGESEDLAGASFAGQYDTYLWIQGIDQVLAHVRRCWAGMFGTAVLTYKPAAADSEPPDATHGICVGIQQMVEASSAGVMFTLDPVTGDRSKIAIEACWGLGEGVVKGDVNPARFTVDKVTFEVLDRQVSVQEEEYRFDPATAVVGLMPTATDRREQPCLADDKVADLARLAKHIERERGEPQDIEWAITEHGDVRVLQVRPETVWSRRSDAREPILRAAGSAVDHVLARFGGAPTPGAGSK